jgi:hypothetical protein
MLSAEERRRLDEIERLLQLDDPRFVARMRAERRPRRGWVPPIFYGVLWLLALVIGAFVSWAAAVVFTMLVAAVGVALLTVAAVRRRRPRGAGDWRQPGC